jgi:hypothetical protein
MQPLWGARRAALTAFGELAGIPDGTTHPISWQMPNTSGRVSSGYNAVTFTPTATGTQGLPITGNTVITFNVDPAPLQLVVSTSGSTSITFSLTGAAAAILNAVGSISVQFTIDPVNIEALSEVSGSSIVTFTATVTPKGVGVMEGSVTPFTELSPQNLAAAVWNSLATDYIQEGTMGKQLTSAKTNSDLIPAIV